MNQIKIDVVLLTKNSLKPCLKECVDSIYKNIPVNRLIVVDGGSTDRTIELLQTYPNVELIYDKKGTRATARQKGIKAVETQWHVHVDSDVILASGWFNKAWENVKSDTGAVWGVAVASEKHFYNINYAMSKLYRIDMKDLLVKQMRGERCMMHDTLIRTAAVADIVIPADLHVYEDDFIGRYIMQKGYRFLKVTSPSCLHNLTPNERFTGFITTGYLLKKHNYGKSSTILRWLAGSLPKSIWIYLVTRDFEASVTHFRSNVLIFKGWLAA